jgi:TRAP-type C4-dicarboxylate transport system permease small subunit
MNSLKKINEQLTRALLVLAAVHAFLLCFLVLADVVGRVVFNSPVKGTTEIVSLSIVVICYLQAGYAIRSGGMLHVEMFVSKASPRGQSIMAAIAALAGLGFFALVCFGSLEGASHAWTTNEFEGEGAMRVPVWPARFVLVFGTLMASISYLLLFIEDCARAIRGELPSLSSSTH